MSAVSIVIPTLNRPEPLAQVVDQLLTYPTPPHEIIIVDQTEHVLGIRPPDLGGRSNCIRHVHLDSAGPCIARNTGARLATGDILWFLDDDMELQPEDDPVAYIANHFETYPESVLVGLFKEMISTPTSVMQMSSRFDIYRHLTRHVPVFHGEYRFSMNIPAGVFAIPRHLFAEIGGFDERFDPDGAFEDRDLGLRCFYRGIPVYESSTFTVGHKALAVGGRRQDRSNASGNLYYFWSKYLSEDMYYLQSFSYWLSRPSRARSILRSILKLFLRRIIGVPDYRKYSLN